MSTNSLSPSQPGFWGGVTLSLPKLYIDFSSQESCVLFLESMRALHLYEEETGKPSPRSKRLKQFLSEAYAQLSDCVRIYPDDRVPHFYYAIVLTIKNQDDYTELLRNLKPALVAKGRFLVFRATLRQMEPTLDPEAQSGPPAPDDDCAWVRAKYKDAQTNASPFVALALGNWPLLDEASQEFEFVQVQGPEELKTTASYNLAQVYSRRAGKYLATGLDLLGGIKLNPTTDDECALALQIDVLRYSLRARQLIDTKGKRADFDSSWKSLEEMPVRIKFSQRRSSNQNTSRLPAGYQTDLQADYLVKSGYVLYEQALYDQFTDAPLTSLETAASRFSSALVVRKSWNQAQLYLATVRTIQSGVAEAQAELARQFPNSTLQPSQGAAVFSAQADKLFEALLGNPSSTPQPKEPAPSQADAFFKAARELLQAIQGPDPQAKSGPAAPPAAKPAGGN
jgi:hypothetical protein